MNHSSMTIFILFALSILSIGTYFVYLNKYQKRSNNKILRLVIMPPVLVLLGLLPWWLLLKRTRLDLGISYYIIVFVVAWASTLGGLLTREKPEKEKDRIIWKVGAVYGWGLMILYVIFFFFIITMLVLMISRR